MSFRPRNEQFLANSRKSRKCAEAYFCTPHKQFRQTCHVFSVIDTEIVEKGHLWTETNLRWSLAIDTTEFSGEIGKVVKGTAVLVNRKVLAVHI